MSGYKRVLLVINGITLLMGILLLAITAYVYVHNPTSMVVPKWTMHASMAFGAIMALISCLGFYGALSAEQKLRSRKTNCALGAYFFVVFIAFIIQVAVLGVLAFFVGLVKDATATEFINSHGRKATLELEKHVQTLLTNNARQWIDIQKAFDCCGYNSTTDSLATGPACNTNSSIVMFNDNTTVSVCRNKLLQSAKHNAVSVIAITTVVAVLEFIAFVSACCLLFCVKPKKGNEYYRNLPDFA